MQTTIYTGLHHIIVPAYLRRMKILVNLSWVCRLDYKVITGIFIIILLITSGFAPVFATPPPPKFDGTMGVVSISFDHGFYSQINPMLYLRHYNLNGTIWVVANRTVFQNVNLFPWSQLQTFYNLGFEMESHSRIHLTETAGLNNATLYSEIYGSKQDMQNHGFLVCGFVPPSSAYNATTLSIISKFYNYSAMQAVNPNTLATLAASNPGGAPLVKIIGVGNLDPTQLSYVQNFTAAKFQIDKAINGKSWLVLHFHDIVNNTSNFAGLQYPTAFTLYQQIIDYVYNKTKAGVLREMPESQAMGFGQRCEIITDKIPPTVSTPSGISLIVPSTTGVKVNYTATATDNVGLLSGPTCNISSGSVFPLGNSTVTCTATDWAGNIGKRSFVVSVRSDTIPPTITVPSNISAQATSVAGAQVSYTVTASDNVAVTSGPTCNPLSGSVFPIGSTTVTCTASDAAGNIGTNSFVVAVKDTIPPTIVPPSNITIQATGSLTHVNLGVPTVSDNVDPHPVITNNAPSSGFSPGTTLVVWKATDFSGNSATATQQVTITQIHTGLALNTISNLPWGNSLTVSGRLTNSTGSGVANEIISFNGTGASTLPTATTDSSGFFSSTGKSPNTVSTRLTVQAHFAGDSLYLGSGSTVNAYNTLIHNTVFWSLNVPASVKHGTLYTVSGKLKDSTTGLFLPSQTVTFTATSPIVIPNAVTDSTGTYTTSKLVAPAAGSYNIQATFAGNSLYTSSSSVTKAMIVT